MFWTHIKCRHNFFRIRILENICFWALQKTGFLKKILHTCHCPEHYIYPHVGSMGVWSTHLIRRMAASNLSLTSDPYSWVLMTITEPLLTLSAGNPFLSKATSLYTLPVLTPDTNLILNFKSCLCCWKDLDFELELEFDNVKP